MDLTDTLIQRIETYFNGLMSAEERKAFEREMAADSELAQQVHNYQEARKAVDIYGENQIKVRLTNRYRQARETAKIRRFSPVSWVAVAASICLLIAVSLWLFNQNKTYSNEELYAQYYEPASLGIIRDTDSDYAQLMIAKETFDSQNYEDAVPLFLELVEDSIFDRKPYAYFHLGISYLELENTGQAVEAFDAVSESSTFTWNAKWFKALALLKLGQSDKAKILFEEIAKGSNKFGSDAEDILDKML